MIAGLDGEIDLVEHQRIGRAVAEADAPEFDPALERRSPEAGPAKLGSWSASAMSERRSRWRPSMRKAIDWSISEAARCRNWVL